MPHYIYSSSSAAVERPKWKKILSRLLQCWSSGAPLVWLPRVQRVSLRVCVRVVHLWGASAGAIYTCVCLTRPAFSFYSPLSIQQRTTTRKTPPQQQQQRQLLSLGHRTQKPRHFFNVSESSTLQHAPHTCGHLRDLLPPCMQSSRGCSLYA